MGIRAGTGEALAKPLLDPVMSPLPPLARGTTVGHMGSHAVTVDGKVVASAVDSTIELGCTGVAPQGQSSPLWPQWAAAWLLVPHSRTLERPMLGSVRSFSTIRVCVTQK